ncbi:hypothetical protein LC593_34270 [Nostoc sp. CHAB 5844]|nr:hypothetical protein [Nostoc sp. CHAB 5844]
MIDAEDFDDSGEIVLEVKQASQELYKSECQYRKPAKLAPSTEKRSIQHRAFSMPQTRP